MSNYYAQQPNAAYGPGGAQNLQFYQSSYPAAGSAPPPQQASYGFGAGAPQTGFSSPGFGAPGGVSGRMGDSSAGLRTGWVAAFSTEGYDGEPPLLEEIGVNFDHIRAKTLAVLNPFRPVDQHIMDDSDLAGPVIFFMLDGTFLLFSGQVHFGYIYGLALLGSFSLHFIISLMSPSGAAHEQASHAPYPPHPQFGDPQTSGAGGGHFSSTLTFPRSASILGYCLLPLVATSALGVVFPMNTLVGHLVTSLAIFWSTFSAAGLFAITGRLVSARAVLSYPLFLFYCSFGLMSIFSSRGAESTLSSEHGG